MYYRYYHDPGDHNTRAHYGVRTETHKLICYWKTDEWEMFDLANDPLELHNLYGQPGQERLFETLRAELLRLKKRSETTTGSPIRNRRPEWTASARLRGR